LLLRADPQILGRMAAYLGEHRVPEAAKASWMTRWRLPASGADARLAHRLRLAPKPRFELRHGDQVVPLVEPVVIERLGNALEETVQIVFLEPVDAICN